MTVQLTPVTLPKGSSPLVTRALSPSAECDIQCGPSCEWIFSRLRVWPRITGGTIVEWSLHPRFAGLPPYEFQLQVGRIGVADTGRVEYAADFVDPVWEDVGFPVTDTYYAIDSEQRVHGKSQWTHYRLKLSTSSGVFLSRPEPAHGTLGRLMWRRAREISRKETLRLRVEAGQEGFLLKRRLFGATCDCLDPQTSEVRNPQCDVCYGTGFVDGYFQPYSCFYVDMTPHGHNNNLDDKRATVDDATVAPGRMLNVPQVFSSDVWVAKGSDFRWHIRAIKHIVELHGVPIVLKAEMRLLPFTHPVYRIDLP